jgi:hypothetical protein
MISPEDQEEFGITDAERRKRKVRRRMDFERTKVTIASIVTIIVTVGAIILAK